VKTKKRKPIMIFSGCEAECRKCGAVVEFENVEIESIVPEKRGLVMNMAEPLYCTKCGEYNPVITVRRGKEYDLTVHLSEAVK